ncbi:MAG: phosphatidylserine decarboxylase [Planctomycetota bacterium]|nr:phosphatidylserine decarboxylase [Planctomycetota bacterium]
MTLSLYGLKEWLLATIVAAVVAAVALAVGWWWIAIVAFVLWAAVIWFFRDPLGRTPQTDDPHDLVSPADGRISAIERVDDHPATRGPAVIVRIFLSVLDVHVNRTPCDLTVEELIYKPGKYLDARSEESARVNESNLIVMTTDSGERIGVRQVSGAIARRIVCPLRRGDRLERAQRFGMIKFGSTTELILPDRGPDHPRIHVKKGDRVRGAVTILANLPSGPKPE